MDIKAIVNQIVDKIKADPKLLESFKKDPEKTLEGLTGVDIPDGKTDALIAGVKAKLGDTEGALGSIGGALKKLF